VVAAWDDDPESFDYSVTRDHWAILEASTDADGRLLQVVKLPAPSYDRIRRGGSTDMAAGYLNYYVGNGFVLLPEFGDRDADEYAQRVVGDLYPGRALEVLDIDYIAMGGGGIHCATQQQPVSNVRPFVGCHFSLLYFCICIPHFPYIYP
jgi:agmatine deiminase